jgi:hypothetical protein
LSPNRGASLIVSRITTLRLYGVADSAASLAIAIILAVDSEDLCKLLSHADLSGPVHGEAETAGSSLGEAEVRLRL